MTRVMSRVALAVVAVCATAVVATAQQTATSTETKSFEIIAVDGNQLVVKLPEGTRELTVPSDFRFTVNGQQLAVSDLKAGMKGTATITTRTTVTPVTVTEVKNGTVVQRSGSTIIVRTGNEVKMFSQGDIDKRGVKIVKDGRPAQLSDFREGDQLSATIVTSRPPHVMTEQEVRATVPSGSKGSVRRFGCVLALNRRFVGERGAGPERQDAAENRELVAHARARKRVVARDGARADPRAPLRWLGDCFPGAALVPNAERGWLLLRLAGQ
jgi:hypothetical protein